MCQAGLLGRLIPRKLALLADRSWGESMRLPTERLSVTVLWVPLLLFGCDRQPPLPPGAIPGDDRAVYAHVGLTAGLRNETRAVAFDSQTVTVAAVDSMVREHNPGLMWRDSVPSAYRGAVADLDRKATRSFSTPASLGSAFRETRLAAAAALALPRGSPTCEAFLQQHPGATSFLHFSPVGYSLDSSTAVLFFIQNCWWGHGESGDLVLLQRDPTGRLGWSGTRLLWYF